MELKTLAKDIEKLLPKYIKEMFDINLIEFKYNSRIKSTLGRCITSRNGDTNKIISQKIEISTIVRPQDLKNILAHELVHAVQQQVLGYSNHDSQFNKLAKEIERNSNGKLFDVAGRLYNDDYYAEAHKASQNFSQWAIENQKGYINFVKTNKDLNLYKSLGYKVYENNGPVVSVRHALNSQKIFKTHYYTKSLSFFENQFKLI